MDKEKTDKTDKAASRSLVEKQINIRNLAFELFLSQFSKIDLSEPANREQAVEKAAIVSSTIDGLITTATTAAIRFMKSATEQIISSVK